MDERKVIQYFLMSVCVLSLVVTAMTREWYNSLMFIVSVAAIVVHNALSPKQNEGPKKEEFEEMKSAISNLGSQLKATTNKITGLRMSIGLKD